MSARASMVHLMPHKVTVKAFVSMDEYGAPTYAATGTEYSARVIGDKRRLINGKGEEVMTNYKVILAVGTVPDKRDQITLPTPFSPVDNSILKLEASYIEKSLHHCTVFV
mgnify:CR=1 FL=1